MTELFRVLTVEEARRVVARSWGAGEGTTEEIPLLAALGRVLAREVVAQEGVPGFARSTVDGYAVGAQDTFGASEALPAFLDVVGDIPMGTAPARSIAPGQTMKIATGGMLPSGADGVVMIEYTDSLDGTAVEVRRPVAPGENVIRAGEDWAPGAGVLPAGHRLRPQDLGVLAALGMTRVEVRRPLAVGIISTGDEVVPPEETPGPGQVRDVNSYTLYGLVQAAGGQPHLYGLVPDDYHRLRDTLAQALEEQDMVLISGGSSVGTRDMTGRVLEDLGGQGILFHGIAIKPGKPTLCALAGHKLVWGLPGHPASAMVVFDALVRPLLEQGGYESSTPRSMVQAILKRNLPSGAGRVDYVRVRLFQEDGRWAAEPVFGKSGLLRTMVESDGLVRIPEAKEGLAAGETVEVLLY